MIHAGASKLFRILIWIAVVFSALLGISIFMLYSLGGNGPHLKEAVEQFLSETSGSHAVIGTVNNVSFYPVLGIDVTDVSFSDDPKAAPWMKAGSFKAGMSFWDVFFSRGNLLGLEMSDVYLSAGRLGPAALEIREASLEHEGDDKAYLVASGTYGSLPARARIQMRALKDGRQRDVFGSSSTYPVEFSLGSAVVRAEYVPAHVSGKGWELRDLHVSIDGNDVVLSGEVGMGVKKRENRKTLYGRINRGGSVAFDLTLPDEEKSAIGGVVDLTAVKIQDFTEGEEFETLARFISCLRRDWGIEGPDQVNGEEPEWFSNIDVVARDEGAIRPVFTDILSLALRKPDTEMCGKYFTAPNEDQ